MAGVLCSMLGTTVSVAGRTAKTITRFGDAQVDTAQSKFGGASMLLDGGSDYLTAATISATGDFTYEFWIRFAATPTSGSFQMTGSSGSNGYFAYTNNGGTLRWETGVTGGSGTFYQWWNDTVSTNTWYHIAFVKNGTSLAVYRDGSARTSSGTSGTMSTDKHLFGAATGYIGAWYNATNSVNGWMDEIRLSDNARYTSNFTAPTAAFTNDVNTLLLIHADGADGSTTFTDDNA